MSKTYLSHGTVYKLALDLASFICEQHPDLNPVKVFAIPRGGVSAAYAVMQHNTEIQLVQLASEADIFIDDIIDSGSTMQKYCDDFPGRPFYALIDKTSKADFVPYKYSWVVFPWEGNDESSIEDNITRILQFAGEDVARGGLVETPNRVAKAMKHWFSGYHVNPEDILKVFEDGAETYDQMVVVKDIPIYSKCEHHMADIFGTATIAYIPNGKIVGLSKLSRLADIFARRLQVQERLTQQIADALWQHLSPKGVGVVVKARHMCMESRGLCQQGHSTITTALHGVIKTDPQARSEFLQHVNSKD